MGEGWGEGLPLFQPPFPLAAGRFWFYHISASLIACCQSGRCVRSPKVKPMLRYLIIVTTCGLLLGCGPQDRTSPDALSNSYQIEFGTNPPAGVTVLHARMMGIRDWDAHWIQIRAETNLIDSVVPKSFTKQTHPPEHFHGPRDRYTPDWWILPPAEQFEFYTCDDWRRGNFSSSHAGVAIDRTNGVIYYRCDRID